MPTSRTRKTAPKPPGASKGSSKASKSAQAPAPQPTRTVSRRRQPQPEVQEEAVQTEDEQEPEEDPGVGDNNSQAFESFFPPLTLENFLQQLDKWSIAKLKKALAKANNRRRNRTPPEVSSVACSLVRDREKIVLMLALIGGCREGLIRKELLVQFFFFISFNCLLAYMWYLR